MRQPDVVRRRTRVLEVIEEEHLIARAMTSARDCGRLESMADGTNSLHRDVRGVGAMMRWNWSRTA